MKNDVIYGWENEGTKELFQAILKLRTVKECEDFFRDLMTLHEIGEMAERLRIAKMLDRDMSYLDIADKAGTSTTTVTRVANWLKHGRGGYRLILDRIGK
ncbi:MAG: YerC/YecD family TrpR-related protein [bacterium]|nr:YerC/YecD family TrpR-related protein [bacterium]MDZ4343959.1 YerC/YecD family TrpR-related protein [Candidatus Binatia bacterium]